jgi:hypothetical protein
LFESRLQNCLSSIKRSHNMTWSNMGGEMSVTEVRLTDTHLGTLDWGQRVAYLLQDDGSQTTGLVGLLGTKALRARRVAFDPDRRVVAWEPANGPSEAAEIGGVAVSRRLGKVAH